MSPVLARCMGINLKSLVGVRCTQGLLVQDCVGSEWVVPQENPSHIETLITSTGLRKDARLWGHTHSKADSWHVSETFG